jgi:GalNAc-alpha-(1->4)-GalNAc-alpha-(1->3)-diNAcBac-PP-undecaprenol alpha-1,4-N-acetyl-D-galactosaminyltransferase
MDWVMASLLNSFAGRDNVEVSLLLIGRSRTVEFDISNKIKVHTPDFEFNPQQRNISTFITIRFIRKTIKEINPNTILSFGEYSNILVLLSLRGLIYRIFISDMRNPIIA